MVKWSVQSSLSLLWWGVKVYTLATFAFSLHNLQRQLEVLWPVCWRPLNFASPKKSDQSPAVTARACSTSQQRNLHQRLCGDASLVCPTAWAVAINSCSCGQLRPLQLTPILLSNTTLGCMSNSVFPALGFKLLKQMSGGYLTVVSGTMGTEMARLF